MKSYFIPIMSLALLLWTGSLMQGYAIVHGSGSVLPAVDIYAYKANSAADAMKQHKAYALRLSVPDTIVDLLDKAKGVSMPIGVVLAGPTVGFSMAFAGGLNLTAETLKLANEVFGSQIKEALARLHRGETNAFHPDVPRGNRGRFAEWETGDVYYVIVTLHDSLVPLHEGAVLANVGSKEVKTAFGTTTIPARVIGFEITQTPQTDKNGNQTMLYQAVFSDTAAREYMNARADQRAFKNNKAEMLTRAKQSGYSAYEQPVPKG